MQSSYCNSLGWDWSHHLQMSMRYYMNTISSNLGFKPIPPLYCFMTEQPIVSISFLALLSFHLQLVKFSETIRGRPGFLVNSVLDVLSRQPVCLSALWAIAEGDAIFNGTVCAVPWVLSCALLSAEDGVLITVKFRLGNHQARIVFRASVFYAWNGEERKRNPY